MPADRGALTSELRRILDCSYPASLAHLADILAHVSNFDIRTCILGLPPCDTEKLAWLVSQALPLWPYALLVLSCLCQAPEFRNALLVQNPSLLDGLLTKAISSEHSFDEYHSICVLLLSRSLPESVTLPASAQSFFLQAFERASRDPSITTLKPVYHMLNGACQDLLSILPVEKRQHFDEELCHILSSSNGAKQDFTLLLWCFGIVLLAEYPGDVGRPIVDSNLERKWSSASGRMLFGSSSKIHKTINLTYLSVIWAAKGDVGISDEEALGSIHIAVQTLQLIEPAILKAWPKSSALAKNTFPKLLSKMSRPHINPAVQLEALTVYAMIAGEADLPADTVTQYEQCLSNLAMSIDAERVRETLGVSLSLYASRMSDPTLHVLLDGALDACISPLAHPHALMYIGSVEQLATALANSATLKAKVLSVAVSHHTQAKISRLLQSKFDKRVASCYTYATHIQRELLSATIALLVMLAAMGQSSAYSLPITLTLALISKQRQLRSSSRECHHGRALPEPSGISLFQQKNTPYTQHLEDWRQRLRSEIDSQGYHQRDLVVRSVAQICQDLETRCNTVEEPLRREKEKSEELERRIHQLIETNSSLESQAADSRFQLDGIEDEKLSLLDEKDTLTAKLDDLQRRYDEANQEANNTLQSVKEHFNATELEFRSAVLKHEETLQSRNVELEAQRRTIAEVQGQLSDSWQQREALDEELSNLQQRHRDAEERLEIERAGMMSQQHEYAQLKYCKINFENELQNTKMELETTVANWNSLQVEHQELKQSSEAARRDLDTRYKQDMAASIKRNEEEHSKLNAQIEESLQRSRQLERDCEQARADYRSLQETVPPLEARLDELSEVCTEQEEELKDLRTLRKNVLASMGLDAQPTLPIRPASRNRTNIISAPPLREPREHRRRKSTLQAHQHILRTPAAEERVTEAVMGNTVSPSLAESDPHSSQGSSPKRLKPRKLFKVSTLQNPMASKQAFSTKRSALRQISPNRRHTTVGFAFSDIEEGAQNEGAYSKIRRRGSCQSLDAPDIDMDSCLAGTPLTQGDFAAGTGRLPAEDDDEGTMTEL